MSAKSFKTTIKYEKEVDLDFVVNEANEIWGFIKKGNTVLDEVFSNYTDFCKAYPLVVKCMFDMGEYSPIIFKQWLKRISTSSSWTNENEYLNDWADYMVRLYKHNNPRAPKSTIKKIRAYYVDELTKERTEFKNRVKLCSSEVENHIKEHKQRNATELKAYASALGPGGADLAENTVLITDIPINQLSAEPSGLFHTGASPVLKISSAELL
jgi:hypothetical protein